MSPNIDACHILNTDAPSSSPPPQDQSQSLSGRNKISGIISTSIISNIPQSIIWDTKEQAACSASSVSIQKNSQTDSSK